jgi:hypothetical protein
MPMTNKVFFGCNYNDKSIKRQIDNMKKRIEIDMPISCVIIDKKATKAANDLWNDIKTEIDKSDLCIFDVSGFRPNVVLELGYALAVKNTNQIIITFRQRKNKGKIPDWLLSDIGHLQRNEYNHVSTLEILIRNEINQIDYIKHLGSFEKECRKSNDKYYQYGLTVLMEIRDNGSKNDEQLKYIIKGSNCRYDKLIDLLTKHNLIQLSNGRYFI